MKRKSIYTSLLACTLLWTMSTLLVSCRGDEIYIQPEEEKKGEQQTSELRGFYLLNEGNMGSNKASLDFYDLATATYTRNIYQAANPTITQSLGDVGNDIAIYGSKLYAVINCSNLVEVMDAQTAKHIGTINVPNCRYLCFDKGYGYITSYAGPVLIDQNYKQRGYVLRFDTATLQPVDTCHVGFQPDGLAVAGNEMFVANSGGYMVPNYEDELSVIDLTTFKETSRIKVARNLQHVLKDAYGQLWVTSRGDYYDQPSRLYIVDPKSHALTDSVCVAASGLWLDGDSLYVYGSEFNYVSGQWKNTFAIVNVKTRAIETDNFITDGTETELQKPYGLAVNPVSKQIYLTDAKTYVTPGWLHCYGPEGKREWSVRTGDIPAHIVFLYSK
ncbi:MAG: YncE family protein [Paludibacteraceae bacterium]|nr:YncE family protein [Paludibacteraceae bacterium]